MELCARSLDERVRVWEAPCALSAARARRGQQRALNTLLNSTRTGGEVVIGLLLVLRTKGCSSMAEYVQCKAGLTAIPDEVCMLQQAV